MGYERIIDRLPDPLAPSSQHYNRLLLFKAIAGNDYFVIQGIALFIILSIGVVLLILDLVYPLIDPRIRYRRG